MVLNLFTRYFTTSLGRSIALSSAGLALIVLASPALSAQDPVADAEAVAEAAVEKKIIREPVHRIHKVASNSSNVAATVSPRTPVVEPTNVKQPNANNKAPTILPSAVKTLPSVTPEASVADPDASRSMIPAKPASSSKLVPSTTPAPLVEPKPAPHPLDDALGTARRGLESLRANIRDYSAIMVKRERVNGKLLKPEYMQIKVRQEGVSETGAKIPFSIYMKFIKPRACAGREVIWIEGQNKNQLCVHEGSGLMALKKFHLDPDSWLAMKGQRYPIYEAGMENLIVKLIEKAERDRAAGHCEVVYRDGVKINGRDCSVIEVTHPQQREPYDFHTAKVYIDTEMKLPIRYQAHLWPVPGSTKPQLLEEYTYLNVKVNQGFSDEDFSPDNAAYSYPKR